MDYLAEVFNLIHTAKEYCNAWSQMEKAWDQRPSEKALFTASKYFSFAEAHFKRLKTVLWAADYEAIQSALRYSDSEVVGIIQRAMDENEDSLTISQDTTTLGIED